MTYWVMSPAEYRPTGERGNCYRKCWQYDLGHGVISIGWDVGEAPESREHLRWLWETYADPSWREHGLKMLSYFWFDIIPGDIVIARAGLLRYVGVGEFQGEPYYDESVRGSTWGCSMRRVRWDSRIGETLSPVRFGGNTLYPLSPDKAPLFEV